MPTLLVQPLIKESIMTNQTQIEVFPESWDDDILNFFSEEELTKKWEEERELELLVDEEEFMEYSGETPEEHLEDEYLPA